MRRQTFSYLRVLWPSFGLILLGALLSYYLSLRIFPGRSLAGAVSAAIGLWYMYLVIVVVGLLALLIAGYRIRRCKGAVKDAALGGALLSLIISVVWAANLLIQHYTIPDYHSFHFLLLSLMAPASLLARIEFIFGSILGYLPTIILYGVAFCLLGWFLGGRDKKIFQ
ncbi:MAG: hypothetical protein ACOCWQ_01045 [Nanoarchaeota archaeon]